VVGKGGGWLAQVSAQAQFQYHPLVLHHAQYDLDIRLRVRIVVIERVGDANAGLTASAEDRWMEDSGQI